MNEQSWVCTGGTFGRLWYGHLSHESEGEPCSVNFPYNWVMNREETKNDVVGFMHTHPNFLANPSNRDVSTMNQWILSFGKPLMCLIEGVDGLKAYLFYDDEKNFIRCPTVKQFGQLVVVIMPPKKKYAKSVIVPVSRTIPLNVEDDYDDFQIIDWDDPSFFGGEEW